MSTVRHGVPLSELSTLSRHPVFVRGAVNPPVPRDPSQRVRARLASRYLHPFDSPTTVNLLEYLGDVPIRPLDMKTNNKGGPGWNCTETKLWCIVTKMMKWKGDIDLSIVNEIPGLLKKVTMDSYEIFQPIFVNHAHSIRTVGYSLHLPFSYPLVVHAALLL